MKLAQSPQAEKALKLVKKLQAKMKTELEATSQALGTPSDFQPVHWLRDGGDHGGGDRLVAPTGEMFNRGSVNVSQVQYEDDPNKRLASATALSTIIHPHNPLAPSVHMHISWTESKNGSGYWRMMADLNPSIPHQSSQERFIKVLRDSVPGEVVQAGLDDGDRYFYIPALERHRGVAHFYLENFNRGDWDTDHQVAETLGTNVINLYAQIIKDRISECPDPKPEDFEAQLAYHSLYLFQVLTLDRGTTSGILVHDQNDLGIMGSLPSHVNQKLLESWQSKLPKPQDQLLSAICGCLETGEKSAVNDDVKLKLAQAVRAHYQKNPEALKLQAAGSVIPPTVANHANGQP